MIALLLALVVALTAPTAPPDVPPLRNLMTPAKVLARYAAALASLVPPHAISFEYLLEQTGARDLLQEHRRKLDPPAIRITHGRRDRYQVATLAPKPDAYDFRLIGTVRDGHHEDWVFATTPHTEAAFRVTEVTIDGISYLPTSIAFATDAHNGTGTIAFGRVEGYWVPTVATARATYAKLAAQERITFTSYRFPTALPPGTFARAHPVAALKPES